MTYTAFDMRSPGAQGGAASGHFTVDEPVLRFDMWTVPEIGVPTTGNLHLGEHNAFNGGFLEHTKEVLNYLLK
jgi:hypothetical protein